MRIEINKLSSKYKVKELKVSDAATVYKLECKIRFIGVLSSYSEHTECVR